jgi:hypothetical protein
MYAYEIRTGYKSQGQWADEQKPIEFVYPYHQAVSPTANTGIIARIQIDSLLIAETRGSPPLVCRTELH